MWQQLAKQKVNTRVAQLDLAPSTKEKITNAEMQLG